MQTENKMVNGVNLEGLVGTIQAISGDPTIAEFTFRNRNYWINGGHNRSTIDKFYGAKETHSRTTPFVMDNDEPPVLLGEDNGANPVEFVLHGMAGCITTTLVYHAAARGIRIEEVSTSFEGSLDLRGLLDMSTDIRPGYQGITVNVKVKGDASKEELEDLTRFASKHSPVFDIVSNPVPVSLNVEVQ